MNKGKAVFVGLSGGVDSSVSAALLKRQGYNVIGVYMKNWSRDLPGMPCPWQDDYQDAKRVAVQLGIGFKVYDFQKDYQQRVVDYMIDGFKKGLTPNPDVMCNQEIKFKLFLDTALEDGADMVATGHYAKVATRNQETANSKLQTKSGKLNHQPPHLLCAKDVSKDQTYFLYRITAEALAKTIFPLGDLTKPEVRKLAAKYKLVTATKKESMGICFVGKVGIKEFLQQFVETSPGAVIDQSAGQRRQIGEHDGAIFYTIGQRHGLEVGGGLPYYVTGKDMDKNEVYVTTNLDDKKLWSKEFNITSVHWINPPAAEQKLSVRLRHRGQLISCKLEGSKVTLDDEQRALTPGQSAVFYADSECLGGGIIC